MLRNDILERKDDILQWIKEKQSKAYMCKELKCCPETLARYLGIMNIQYDGNQGLKDKKTLSYTYIPADQYILGSSVSSSKLRDKLIREGLREAKCERCGLDSWQGEPIALELHHIDGNHYNNVFDNLQILCPNCHSLTQNYRNRYYKLINNKELIEQHKEKYNKKQEEKVNQCIICGKAIDRRAKYCPSCWHYTNRKVERPDRETLKNEIRSISFLQLGEKYGISDKAIKKWCITYKLPYKKQDIKTYSDEEWEKL